jgi:hypothetical protein
MQAGPKPVRMASELPVGLLFPAIATVASSSILTTRLSSWIPSSHAYS